ncbi:MAG: EAL domain-containing protein [Actinobacteria bacterium]|nr:MAG: EAL domain-containing protein [Actinomycetota bacterium]
MDETGRDGSRFLLESWLDFGDALSDQPELRKLLFDPVTGLPTTPLLFPRISTLLEERGEVSLLCVNVVRYSRIEEIYGWQVFDEVMREVAHALDVIAGEVLRDSDAIAELMNSGNAFVIVLSPPRTTSIIDPSARVMLARRVESAVRERLAESIEPALFKKFGCYVGAATVCRDDQTRLERLVYDALEQALTDSNEREAADAVERIARLREILAGEQIRTLLHPVFELESMDVVGYEALSRGPEGSEFERPDKLFSVAYDADLVLRLERVCRKRALEMAAGLPDDRLLFVNIEPEAVCDPQLRDAVSASMVAESAVPPNRVVLELTERTAIHDFASFRSTLEYLRALGFSVAVDDAGAGYGSLQCLAEVRPDWLKIDLSLVRGCDSDEVRASLIESLVRFAQRVGGKLVAEGIETEAELATIRELGVQYGQGFLLAQPSAGFPDDATLPAKQFAR